MNLYQQLFGMVVMGPEDGESAGGGAIDRGDNFAPTDNTPETDKTADNAQLEEDLKVATGEDKEDALDEQPRDSQGKFTKKEKSADDSVIPKSRFDSAVQKERERAEAAERELAEIRRAQQQIARGADIGKLEVEVRDLRAEANKALIAGDSEKAAEMTEKADRLNRQIAIEQARDMTAAAKEQAREEIRWDMTLESIENKYPALDDKSDEFDQDLTDDVVDAMEGIMRRERLPRSQALLKAVKRVMERRDTSSASKDDGAPKGLDRGPEKDRKEAAVQKNLDAANRQPASSKRTGADSDRHGQTAPVPSADQMTYEEFSALPEATKAKMRGDHV